MGASILTVVIVAGVARAAGGAGPATPLARAERASFDGVPERHYRVISGNPCTTRPPDSGACWVVKNSGTGAWYYGPCTLDAEGSVVERSYSFFGEDELVWDNELFARGRARMECNGNSGTLVAWDYAEPGTVVYELQGRQTDAREGRVEGVTDIALGYGIVLLLRLERRAEDGSWLTLAEERQVGGSGAGRQTRRLSGSAGSLERVRLTVTYERALLQSGIGGATLYDASLSVPTCVPDPTTGACAQR